MQESFSANPLQDYQNRRVFSQSFKQRTFDIEDGSSSIANTVSVSEAADVLEIVSEEDEVAMTTL